MRNRLTGKSLTIKPCYFTFLSFLLYFLVLTKYTFSCRFGARLLKRCFVECRWCKIKPHDSRQRGIFAQNAQHGVSRFFVSKASNAHADFVVN
jgi:hypothetical protein